MRGDMWITSRFVLLLIGYLGIIPECKYEMYSLIFPQIIYLSIVEYTHPKYNAEVVMIKARKQTTWR